MSNHYSSDELRELGIIKIGSNVMISKKVSIYGASDISIGHNVRIDDFCILSGKITLGNYIHIAAYSALFGGKAGIVVEDYAGFSSRTTIYAASDDYSGETMTNPTIPEKYKNVRQGQVTIKKHVIVGASCIILPGAILGEGSAVGAMSLINKSIDAWGIYGGVPARRTKDRKKNILELEERFMKDPEFKCE